MFSVICVACSVRCSVRYLVCSVPFSGVPPAFYPRRCLASNILNRHFIEVWNSYRCLIDAFSASYYSFIDAQLRVCWILKYFEIFILKYYHKNNVINYFVKIIISNWNIYYQVQVLHNLAGLYIFKHSFITHRCLISQIDALSMPFSMGDEKGIDIDARLRSSMPSGTPAFLVYSLLPGPRYLWFLLAGRWLRYQPGGSRLY